MDQKKKNLPLAKKFNFWSNGKYILMYVLHDILDMLACARGHQWNMGAFLCDCMYGLALLKVLMNL